VQGYVDFGRFNNFNHFVAGSGRVDFVQVRSLLVNYVVLNFVDDDIMLYL
jgi:hypothetical protein